jgi:diaminopimelate decarboxylase
MLMSIPRFSLTESLARELVQTYQTPLYVMDENGFRKRIRAYLAAFSKAYDKTEISFATKANSTIGIIKIAAEEGCHIDVASEGEFRAALAAGTPAAQCHLHGNNKSRAEIEFALEKGIGTIVIDHFDEINTVASIPRTITDFVLRLAPGVDPHTHSRISTGQSDTKFGFNISDGSAEKALLLAQKNGLKVKGFHCHVGSQLLDPEAQRAGGEALATFAVEMLRKHAFATEYLNVGGGLGARYLDSDKPMPVEQYCQLVVESIRPILEANNLHPVLAQEPGRALVAEAGVTLYTVGVVKSVPISEGQKRTYVSVDGGLADNPRPALYEAKYTVERIAKQDHEWEYVTDGPGCAAVVPVGDMVVTVSGRHCETDQLFSDITLPADIKAGDILQVRTTGAYNASMASNYNRYQRPSMVLLHPDGTHNLIARRDTWDEMFVRELDLGNK